MFESESAITRGHGLWKGKLAELRECLCQMNFLFNVKFAATTTTLSRPRPEFLQSNPSKVKSSILCERKAVRFKSMNRNKRKR